MPNKVLRKPKKRVICNTLANPYKAFWPKVKNEERIVQVLRSTLLQVADAQRKSNFIDVQEISKTGKEVMRKALVFGFNETTKALHRGLLVAVIVNRQSEPSVLTKSFIPLLLNGAVPAVCLASLGPVLKETLGYRKIIAVGLTREAKKKGNHFEKLREVIQEEAVAPYITGSLQFEPELWHPIPSTDDKEKTEEKVEPRQEQSTHFLHLKREQGKDRFIPRGFREKSPPKVETDILKMDFIDLSSTSKPKTAGVFKLHSTVIKKLQNNQNKVRR